MMPSGRRRGSVGDGGEVAGQRCCLVYDDCLLQLATLKVDSKCRVKGCGSENVMQLKRVGSTALHIWTCAKGHKGRRWSSQTKLRKRGVYAGDFLLATNILLSGNKFMNLGIVSWVQFERIQALYAIPTIMGYWERLRAVPSSSCRALICWTLEETDVFL